MKNPRRILIVGAGVAGKELFLQLRANLNHIFEVVGFIDDDAKKKKANVNNLKILGGVEDLESIIKKFKVEEVFIALPSVEGEIVKRIIETCNQQRVVFKIVPRILEIVLGKVKLQQVREVRIEDLLGRPIIKSDQEKFIKVFKNKKVLVTGAAGSIGSELCRQLIQFSPKSLICLDAWEGGLFDLESQLLSYQDSKFKVIVANIRDKVKIQSIFEAYNPEFVFHAAAYKHVPLMQVNADEAVKNNVFGTKNLTEAALRNKTKKFINISTDKAADPSSVMGATKLLAEKIVSQANFKKITKFTSVRFGNVLDSQGSVVPIFRNQIQNGGPVTVTDPKMLRFFMTIPEAVQLVLQAAILGKGGETFVLDMGQPVKIDDLARLMIRLSGFIPDEEIKIKYIGKRPGEKLVEVLNTNSEFLTKTSNEKILIINKTESIDKKLDKTLTLLEKKTSSKNIKDLVNFLKSLAPNLQS